MFRLLTALLLIGLATPAVAQAPWPNRPIRLVVPVPPGGASDAMARMMAQSITDGFGQPVFVDNRPGAGGTIGTAFAAQSAPDGHVLLLGGVTTLINAAVLFPNPGYDGLRDFAPIAPFASVANIVVVHPSVPVNNIQELIAYARQNPGRLNYGSAGAGGSLHLAAELFKLRTGTDIVHVPYRGGAAMVTDLIAGQVQLAFDNFPQSYPHVRSGALRALAVTSAERWPLAPEYPTVQESGVPDFDINPWFGLMAPARTPPDIIARINARLRLTLTDPAVVARLADLGAAPLSMPVEAFLRFFHADAARGLELIRISGAKVD